MKTWTTEDAYRAAKEGWALVSGYPTSTYKHSGSIHFDKPYKLLETIYEKSKTSEWHHEVFLSLPWTNIDWALAQKEGWAINRRTWEIVSLDPRLTNEQARQAFLERAKQGNALAMKAIRHVTRKRLEQ